ncbi:MAG TPA: hypothetical protein VJP78_09680 [Thermoleophilia bacterium]|nr:hypothetical protein [Thermoleophilia bacterium]
MDIQRLTSEDQHKLLLELAEGLMADLKRNSDEKRMEFSHDTLTVQCVYPRLSKPIIDAIDRRLARHYGFTGEELDFIVNYDIKYRMGSGHRAEDDDHDPR